MRGVCLIVALLVVGCSSGEAGTVEAAPRECPVVECQFKDPSLCPDGGTPNLNNDAGAVAQCPEE